MLMQEATPEMAETWKTLYKDYRAKLYPNKKSSLQVIDFLRHRYPVMEETDGSFTEAVFGNVLDNECYAGKVQPGVALTAAVFSVLNCGAGKALYDNQDESFKGQKIYVGVELSTAYFLAEGSSRLWDELFAFRGLDEEDLNNFYLVAEYVTCLKELGMLDSVLQGGPGHGEGRG